MQPHMQQQIKTQHTNWGQGCSYFVVKPHPFRSNSTPLRATLSCSAPYLTRLLYSLCIIFPTLIMWHDLWYPSMWLWCVTLSCDTFPHLFLQFWFIKKTFFTSNKSSHSLGFRYLPLVNIGCFTGIVLGKALLWATDIPKFNEAWIFIITWIPS